MKIVNAYGFSLDADSGRVYLTEGKVATYQQEIPIGSDGVSRGADHGDIINSTPKVVLNADANLIYVDIAGKPYAGTVKKFSNLPHDELGRLLVDSVGKIVSNYKGLGFTEFGGVAMLATDVPNAPKLNNAYAEKNSVVLDFDYDISKNGDKLEPKYYTGYAVGGGKTFKAEVYDPDEDMLIDGLTEGVTYDCYVTATSIQTKEGPKSNVIKATCKSVIPAPVFKSCVSGDGFATVTFDPVTPPEPWTIDHYAYSAINMDDKTQPAVEGHIENGKIALPNDITWYVRICAVCNPGRVPGDFSDALTVKPETKSIPYPPKITQAYAKQDGTIFVSWEKGANGANAGAMTVDAWRVTFRQIVGGKDEFTVDIPDGKTTSMTSKVVTEGTWFVGVEAKNDMGWSKPSQNASVDFKKSVTDPLLGGQRYNNDKYGFAVFYGDETTGYQAVRTEAGKMMSFDVMLVGAGGAGKGQTVTLGKGGDGGGGQMVLGDLPPTMNTTTITITVPAGGVRNGDSPANVTVVETTTTLTAISGKTATDKNNAEGFPKTKAPEGWNDIMPFTWLMPGSQYVGGVADVGEQNFPNATFRGQGGAGTKDSNPGKGGGAMVIIRWAK
jgi:hypothetical protein